jgi:ATP-dependent RNA helicase DDX21
MASFIGVSSIYQTPTLDLYRRTAATTTPLLSLPLCDKSHFNKVLKAHNTSQKTFSFHSTGTLRSGSKQQSLGFLPSAIATPNSSVLSEEAFKGLGGGFAEDSLDDFYDSEAEPSSAASADQDELALSKLGMPHRLVDTLEKRGITHLFPIQVLSLSLSLSLSIVLGLDDSLAIGKLKPVHSYPYVAFFFFL